jgi:hypothetical protein
VSDNVKSLLWTWLIIAVLLGPAAIWGVHGFIVPGVILGVFAAGLFVYLLNDLVLYVMREVRKGRGPKDQA